MWLDMWLATYNVGHSLQRVVTLRQGGHGKQSVLPSTHYSEPHATYKSTGNVCVLYGDWKLKQSQIYVAYPDKCERGTKNCTIKFNCKDFGSGKSSQLWLKFRTVHSWLRTVQVLANVMKV
jgi:hypothetical protein